VSVAAVIGRGVAFPPRVGGDGRIAFSVGEDNVRESIEVILRTELRERLRLPAFGGGLGGALFEPNTAATHRRLQERIVAALAVWEPRIALEGVAVAEDPEDPEAAIATVTYRLVATQAPGRTTVSILLAT
jgi:phage baseplate assembly protein W